MSAGAAPVVPWRGPRRGAVVDTALATVVTAIGLLWAIAPHHDRPEVAPLPIAIVLALTASLPLAVRRSRPLAVLAAVEASMVLHFLLIAPDPRAGALSLVIAVATVAAHRPRAVSLRAAVAVGAVNTLVYLGMLAAGRLDAGPNVVVGAVMVAGAWALGDNLGTRRAYLASLVDRAARLEREQEERAQRAVLSERARIARELHDVVAHHVSAIAVQAGAAEEIAEREPARARAVLADIQATSRQALSEMRALLGVLRREDDAGLLGPQPGLGDVERLAAQSRAAGLDVRVSVEGAPRALPEALDLSAYRIIQEALTNTMKHAGAAHADVLVRYTDTDLEIIVTDDGVEAVPAEMPGGGRGIIGMRERVALFQGRLDVGRAPAGGFRVRAVLPMSGIPA